MRGRILKSSCSTGVLLIVAAITVLVDQFTKYLAVTYLAPIKVLAPIPTLADIFTFTYTTNTGVAFGLFKDLGPVFVVIAVFVIAAIVFYQREVSENALFVRAVLGLMLGGALSNNLIDRIRLGHVIDFLHVHYYSPTVKLDWPVFNVADSAIVVGVILLAFTMLREGKAPAKSAPQPSESTDSNPPASA
jgi:signal peptidase II